MEFASLLAVGEFKLISGMRSSRLVHELGSLMFKREKIQNTVN